MFVLTIALTDKGEPHHLAWLVTRDAAAPFEVEVVDDAADLFAPLGNAWPSSVLATNHVTVVGTGSIGSAASEALSAYALRHLALVDPDRLQSHNFARHRAKRNQVGRRKVNAVADMLLARDSGLEVERFSLDVIENADVMRPLFARSDCILVASDGIASRRAANHLACRAGVPVVFACVLEDGRVGEVIRVRPHVTACLLCSREQLAAAGLINPEPSLDLGYGNGHRHLAMTAVGGDLDLVGRFAARAVVSTLLEYEGFLAERLPNDHAVIGLRPALDREPEAPFDVERTLEVKWHSLGNPSPDCPSCGGTS
jgi:molybdopterin/thiamine biosynthesis adenylyltransferase